MNTEPVTAALRAITETKQLLESLLISSETFDYQEAKKTLKILGRKLRELGKLQSRLMARQKSRVARAPNICIVDFGSSSSPKGSQAP